MKSNPEELLEPARRVFTKEGREPRSSKLEKWKEGSEEGVELSGLACVIVFHSSRDYKSGDGYKEVDEAG